MPSQAWKGRQRTGKVTAAQGDGTATSQRWPISLAPRRTCSHTHLDSSPVASTPKCSHTAGQNCSLQVMKSSSRLARAKERFNNPAQGGVKGYSQRRHLRSLWTSSFTTGKRICPWIQAVFVCLHAHMGGAGRELLLYQPPVPSPGLPRKALLFRLGL